MTIIIAKKLTSQEQKNDYKIYKIYLTVVEENPANDAYQNTLIHKNTPAKDTHISTLDEVTM